MAGHERHALRGELVGHGHGLLRITGIVADRKLQHLAIHAAGGVDVGNGLLGARAQLLTEAGVLAGHGAGDADRDLGKRCASEYQVERCAG